VDRVGVWLKGQKRVSCKRCERVHMNVKRTRKRPSGLLRDMRWVYRHKDEGEDGIGGRETCRKLLKSDPQKFVAQLQAMERDLRNGGPKREQVSAAAKAEEAVTGSAAVVADEGSMAVLELIDRLLGDK
jgi:hypothetical protein